MDEKKIIYLMITDLWNATKNYCFAELDDAGWEHFDRELNELRSKYKEHGENIDRLCRDMIQALIGYKERSSDANNQTIHNRYK